VTIADATAPHVSHAGRDDCRFNTGGVPFTGADGGDSPLTIVSLDTDGGVVDADVVSSARRGDGGTAASLLSTTAAVAAGAGVASERLKRRESDVNVSLFLVFSNHAFIDIVAALKR
jgi:hypothetical protein